MVLPRPMKLLCRALLLLAVTAYPALAEKRPFFGAVHVHTNYSFDAYTNGSHATPNDAYNWARGKAIPSAVGPDLKISTPLDFYAVSDHAEWMGVFRLMEDPSSPLSKHPRAAGITSEDKSVAMEAYASVVRDFSGGYRDPSMSDPKVSSEVWKEIVSTADAHYEPGEFTTFPAFEWSSNLDMRNLHRVLVFRDSATLPQVPFSALDSSDPEDLWHWMDAQRAAGVSLFAIPHNGNASDGLMFSLNTLSGEPLDDEYIRTRRRNEPLYEIAQIKGTSETHPRLSPNDQFAGFELWDYMLSLDGIRPEKYKGSYARQALLSGLNFGYAGRPNPFQFGFIGDSDTHNAAASHEEFNYTGKFGYENDPRQRLRGLEGQSDASLRAMQEFSSGGLAAVWAEENTRDAIYYAMVRRETYGTTGPMIKLRFFGGWDFTPADGAAPNFASRGYARGVPMGGELAGAKDKAPNFMIWAAKDPKSGNLDRVQVVKGWIDGAGEQREKIYNIAWSDSRPMASDGSIPPVGNTVDLKKAGYSNSIGATELSAVWTDPDFDPGVPAFYYVRVLEIPTPRWSTLDAAATGLSLPDNLAKTIQERAYSSPIWYSPRDK